HADAQSIVAELGGIPGLAIAIEGCMSTVGGGAMPTAELPSWAITLAGRNPEQLDRELRAAPVPVIGRIDQGKLWLDVRTISEDEVAELVAALRAVGSPRA